MSRKDSKIVDLARVTKARATLADAVRRWPRLAEPQQQARLATHLQRGDSRTMPKKKISTLVSLFLGLCISGANCGGTDPNPGGPGQECRADGSCYAGFICKKGICVSGPDGGADAVSGN
jgi:hypothetical protein